MVRTSAAKVISRTEMFSNFYNPLVNTVFTSTVSREVFREFYAAFLTENRSSQCTNYPTIFHFYNDFEKASRDMLL